MTDVAEFWSLVLTVPTLGLSALVVSLYGRRSIETVRAIFTRGESPAIYSLLILGICVGFVGSIADNLYWGVAWAAEFFSHESRDWLFSHGVWSNLPFRQAAGIAAATLHIVAASGRWGSLPPSYYLIWIFTILAGGALAFVRAAVAP